MKKSGIVEMYAGKPGSMHEVLRSAYSGKKVFLTGHTGFKGSWLLKQLSMLNAEVKGYSLAPQQTFDIYNLLNGDSLCNSIIADLRDRDKLIKEIIEFQPDYIFHLAAQPLVRLSYDIPADTFAINVIGTANLLDGVQRLSKACHVILITTDKVYQNKEWIYPYRENDRLGGYDPYSASKACAELVIDSYKNSFFNTLQYSEHQKSIAVARAGNVIGGGDWSKDRLIPDVIKSLKESRKVQIRNPASVRPWQHVLEPLLGYLMLGSKLNQDPLKFSSSFNFGPGLTDSLQVSTMVEMAISCWGIGDYEIMQTSGQVHEAGLLQLDISKAIAELGWQPRLNARQAIELTVSWYKTFFSEGENIISFTENQINDFLISK